MINKTLAEHLFEAGVAGFNAEATRADAPTTPEAELLKPSAALTNDNEPILLADDLQLDLAAAVEKTGGGDDDNLGGTRDDDRLIGGNGDDTLKGKAGDDDLFGGNGADRLVGGGGNDSLKGGGGDDVMVGGGGDDTLKGQGGDDNIRGGGGNDVIKGQGGADQIKGNGGNDNIVGGGGNDTIQAGGGDDTLKGGGGNDIFLFAKSEFRKEETNEIRAFQIGRDKIDLVKLSLGTFDNLNITQQGANAVISIDKGQIVLVRRNAADLSASDFFMTQADRNGDTGADPAEPVEPDSPNITGDANDNILDGDERNNLIRGEEGNDTLGAGQGADTLEGGADADVFVVQLVNGQIDPQIDTISDFFYLGGDKIGLNEVLNGVSFPNIEDMLDVRIVGSDTIISVRQGVGQPLQDVFKLEGVQFTKDELKTTGFLAPPNNSTQFVDNPFGFKNETTTTADPAATRDGQYVVWVDQQNLDFNEFDEDVVNSNTSENNASRDIFFISTSEGVIRRVNETSDTTSREAVSPAISEDGRFIVYVQAVSSTNGQVLMKDLLQPELDPIRIDVDSDGVAMGNGAKLTSGNRGGLAGSTSNESFSIVDISGDGSKVVFASTSTLSAADTQSGTVDIYLRDLNAQTTTLLSDFDDAVSSTGTSVKISEDGRYVLFLSKLDLDGVAANAEVEDLYLLDTQTGNFVRVTSPVAGDIGEFDMSADGSRIVYATDEVVTNSDTNDLRDIYVAEVNLDSLAVTSNQRVSVAEGGFQVLDNDSYAPTISPDGDKIIFLSQARDLVNYGDAYNANRDGVNEQMYILDLTTGDLTVPENPSAIAARESLTSHAQLTDDGFVYRADFVVDPVNVAGENTNGAGTADTILFGTEVQPDVDEITNAFSTSTLIASRIDRGSIFRSTIDSASDTDVFYSFSGSSRGVSLFVLGVDSGGGTLANPLVKVFTTGGNQIASNDNALGQDAFVEIDGSVARNEFFVEVSSSDGGTGSYQVLLLDEGITEINTTQPVDFIF